MRSLIRWSIRNSPAVHALLITTLLLGAISFIVMRREVFPNFRLEMLLVTVVFPGATAAEVEQGICEVLESSISGTENVKKMNSVAREGSGFIILELDNTVKDVQPVLNDVRRRIDRVSNQLPPRAEKPELQQIVFRSPSISVGLIGPGTTDDQDLDAEHALRAIGEEIRTELLELRPVQYTTQEKLTNLRAMFAPLYQPKGPAVTSAEIVAQRPYEIVIEVNEDSLRQYGLSLKRFAQAVREHNIDVPGGKMETAGQELLLRGNNRRDSGLKIAELPVLSKPNGDIVRVGDVANVIDGFSDVVSIHRIDGRPGLTIEVSKTEQEDLFTVVDAVKRYIREKKVPAGYELRYWNDVSLDVEDRISMLYRNGVTGLVLVFLVLAVFLDIRLAFWVALGIPISILGSGIVLLLAGHTLNMLTMFAFLMGLGIVVDDAIIIGDNIYQKRLDGLSFIDAAIEGTVEVFPSVCASVATTIMAYMPLMFVSGVMGKFIAIMPIAVIAMLVISLVESMFVLPEHLSHPNNLFLRMLAGVLYIFKPLLWAIEFIKKYMTAILDYVIERIYGPTLDWALHHKSIVVALLVSTLMVTGGMVAGGFISFSFFPELDEQRISATIAFPNGTSAEFSTGATNRLRAAIEKIDQDIQATGRPAVIKTVYEKIGEAGDAFMGPVGVTSGSHVGTVEVLLTPSAERNVTSQELNRRWREAIQKVSGAEVLKFTSAGMGPGGAAIELKCMSGGPDVPHLFDFVEECKEYLATQQGVFDIEDDSRPGKWEMNLTLNEQGQALGLDEANLAETIRGVYYGEEVQRLQRGRHEVKVLVRYPRDERSTMEGLGNVRVRDNGGQQRPLTEVAQIEFGRQPGEIKRMNQKRAITIQADVDVSQGQAYQIIGRMQGEFLPELFEKYRRERGASITADWEGQQAQTTESFYSMFIGLGIAMAAMFVLLIFEFRSYLQAFIVLTIIPFGWLGAFYGHWLVGIDLTLFSFFGLVALTGVVLNDSIVLVDLINSNVRRGMSLHEALIIGGKRRVRPVFLTSATTVAGLLPILSERSMQAQVIIPMAVSIAFGLIATTVVVLYMVPVLYQIYAILVSRFGYSLKEDDDHEGGGGHPVEPVPQTPSVTVPLAEPAGVQPTNGQTSNVGNPDDVMVLK